MRFHLTQLSMSLSDIGGQRSNGGQANFRWRNLETLADTAKCLINDG